MSLKIEPTLLTGFVTDAEALIDAARADLPVIAPMRGTRDFDATLQSLRSAQTHILELAAGSEFFAFPTVTQLARLIAESLTAARSAGRLDTRTLATIRLGLGQLSSQVQAVQRPDPAPEPNPIVLDELRAICAGLPAPFPPDPEPAPAREPVEASIDARPPSPEIVEFALPREFAATVADSVAASGPTHTDHTLDRPTQTAEWTTPPAEQPAEPTAPASSEPTAPAASTNGVHTAPAPTPPPRPATPTKPVSPWSMPTPETIVTPVQPRPAPTPAARNGHAHTPPPLTVEPPTPSEPPAPEPLNSEPLNPEPVNSEPLHAEPPAFEHPAPSEADIVNLATPSLEPVAEAPALAPVDMPTDAPVDMPADMPTDAPVDMPADMPTDAPVDMPADMPAEVALAAPVEPVSVEPVSVEPAPEPEAEVPLASPFDPPVELVAAPEPIIEPFEFPALRPVSIEPADETPAAAPDPEPIAPSAAAPDPEPLPTPQAPEPEPLPLPIAVRIPPTLPIGLGPTRPVERPPLARGTRSPTAPLAPIAPAASIAPPAIDPPAILPPAIEPPAAPPADPDLLELNAVMQLITTLKTRLSDAPTAPAVASAISRAATHFDPPPVPTAAPPAPEPAPELQPEPDVAAPSPLAEEDPTPAAAPIEHESVTELKLGPDPDVAETEPRPVLQFLEDLATKGKILSVPIEIESTAPSLVSEARTLESLRGPLARLMAAFAYTGGGPAPSLRLSAEQAGRMLLVRVCRKGPYGAVRVELEHAAKREQLGPELTALGASVAFKVPAPATIVASVEVLAS